MNAAARVLVVPIGVVAVTFLAVRAAPFVIAQFALIDVAVVPVTVQVTPLPEIVTPVAPVRLFPVSVTGTVVLCRPVAGLIEVNVAPWTVNVVVADPPGVVTVTVLAESAAPVVIVNVAVIVESLTTVTPLTVTPAPETVTAVAPVRFVPVIVTGTAAPRAPVFGAIDANTGAGGAVTANNTLPVVPPGVTMLTFLFDSVAVAAMTKFAVA